MSGSCGLSDLKKNSTYTLSNNAHLRSSGFSVYDKPNHLTNKKLMAKMAKKMGGYKIK